MFVEPPVIVCAPTLESCNFLLLTTASKIILFQPILTAEFSAKHTLLSPPLITLPFPTVAALGTLDGAPVGKTLEAGDELLLGSSMGGPLGAPVGPSLDEIVGS